ncbi:hypothetical protein GNP94_21950 [Paenibacillus campinasensis]|uniref:Cyanophage baseplate Pam3 plug gp18 domain-containing protein n=1 Tax=Paenibacillus campinasensis TaxID=66347 RepID=A0ABW9T7C4_9BACL|nr:hypothetical protein [Paenibacillus campinasensis]MUG68638.1 hypothetical protein [Paenibacillus campinasensis]
MEYIEIEKNLVPYRFDVDLDGEMFTFEVNYNPTHDFFTVDLERDGEVLIRGEKLVYGVPLFTDVWDSRFPTPTIIPWDLSGLSQTVTWDTLSVTVFLYMPSEGDESE